MSFSTLLQSITLLLAVLMLVACSNNASTFVAAPQDADQDSIVYIYRPSSSTNFMMSPKVVVDGSEKFKIGSGGYRYVYLQTGQHTVGLNPTDQYITEAALTINVEAGQSYYLRVQTSLKFEADKMNTRKFWIDTVAEEEALAEIGSTDYSGPELQPSVGPESEGDEDKAGFSVDKTQDPFAGKRQ